MSAPDQALEALALELGKGIFEEAQRTDEPVPGVIWWTDYYARPFLHRAARLFQARPSAPESSSAVSPIDAVRREREAYYQGVSGATTTLREETMRGEARRRYPLPQVKRPRVRVDGNNVQWRVVGGEVEYKLEGSTLGFVRLAGQQMSITLERVGIISDLLDEPTELVEVDSPSPTGDA